MIDQSAFETRIAKLEALLHAKFGGHGRTLQARLRSAGRRLPKRCHKAGKTLIQAQAQMGHPKIWVTLDSAAIDRAFDEITTFLKQVDLTDRRKGVAIGIMAGMAFNLLLVAVLMVLLLKWQGLL